jgi:hypothetical protein
VDPLSERRQPFVTIPGRLHRDGDPVQPIDEMAPVLGLLEEARLVDGERGLIGERRQQGDLVLREPPIARRVDGEDADHLIVDPQRDAEEAVVSVIEGAARARGVEPHVPLQVLGHDGPSGGHDPATQALTDPDPRAGRERGRRLAPGGDDQLLALDETDAGGLRAQQRTRFVDEQGEKRIGVVHGAQPPREIVEHVEPSPLARRLLEEAGIAQETGHLAGDRLQQPELAIRQAAPGGPPDQIERPRHLAVEDQGQEQPRLVAEAAEDLVAEPRISGNVVGRDRAMRGPEREGEALLPQRKRRLEQGGQHLLGDVIAGEGPELVRGRVVQIDGPGVRADQHPQLPANPAKRLPDIEGGTAGP